MAKMRVELVTMHHKWQTFRSGITGTSPTIDFSSGMAHPTLAGPYSRQDTIFMKTVDELFGSDHPNAIMIAPFSESCTVNENAKFRIDVYRGVGNLLDRICYASSVTGTYLFSALGDGTLIATSGRYHDTIILTNDFNHAITLIDAGGDNGKGVIQFDLEGVGMIGVNTISTFTGKMGFEYSGF